MFLPVTDNWPYWIILVGGGTRRKDFIINFHESNSPDWVLNLVPLANQADTLPTAICCPPCYTNDESFGCLYGFLIIPASTESFDQIKLGTSWSGILLTVNTLFVLLEIPRVNHALWQMFLCTFLLSLHSIDSKVTTVLNPGCHICSILNWEVFDYFVALFHFNIAFNAILGGAEYSFIWIWFDYLCKIICLPKCFH